MLNVLPVAPPMALAPKYHWKLNGSSPPAVTVKLALPVVQGALVLTGWLEIVGGVTPPMKVRLPLVSPLK